MSPGDNNKSPEGYSRRVDLGGRAPIARDGSACQELSSGPLRRVSGYSARPALAQVAYPIPNRVLKNYDEPSLRLECAFRLAGWEGVSSTRLSPPNTTPRKRILAQPIGQQRFWSGAALWLPGKARRALHRQPRLARDQNRLLRRPS